MDRELLDVLLTSEKRKKILLMLRNGPVGIPCLLAHLNTSRQGLAPQAKILEDNHLLIRKDDLYELTAIGQILADRMAPLLGVTDTLDVDIDYWGTQDLSFIPGHLLHRIGDLRNCMIVEPSRTDMFELNKLQKERSFASESLGMIVTFFHMEADDVGSKLVEKGIKTSIILSTELFEKMRVNWYERMKYFLSKESVRFFVYDRHLKFINFSVNDYSIFFRLLSISGGHDGRQLIAQGPEAVEWGREFFEYYRRESVEITEI